MTKYQFLDSLHVEISSAQNVKLMLISLWLSCNSDDWLNKMLLKLYRFFCNNKLSQYYFSHSKAYSQESTAVNLCVSVCRSRLRLSLRHVLRWPGIILFFFGLNVTLTSVFNFYSIVILSCDPYILSTKC